MVTSNSKLEVLSDFDGTITNDDIGFRIINTFAGPGWQEIEDAYQRGEKGSREALREIFALTEVSKETLTRFVDEQFHVDLHFPAFLHYCQQANIAVTVLSDGFDFYIDRIFEKFKIDVPYRANTLRIVDCSLQAQFPYHSADCGDCGNCKLSFAQQVKQKGTKIIYIGDGHSDKCVSAFADVVFAKGILAEHCVKKGIPHYTFETFADVLAVCKDGLFAEITR